MEDIIKNCKKKFSFELANKYCALRIAERKTENLHFNIDLMFNFIPEYYKAWQN